MGSVCCRTANNGRTRRVYMAAMRCCLLVLLTGCLSSLGGDSAQEAHERGLRYQTTTMFVATERAWVCPTIPAALAGTACEGGRVVRKNRDVDVIGKTAVGGAWPVADYAPQGEIVKRYIAATAVTAAPDTHALGRYAEDVARRFPEERRISLGKLSIESLFAEAESYRGSYLVLRQLSRKMTNKAFADGRFTFTIGFPTNPGSHHMGPALFELANAELVEEFEAGEHGYRCGPEYCDDFVIVAELTDRTVERADDRGTVRRLPVFAVRELGDRYGSYRSN